MQKTGPKGGMLDRAGIDIGIQEGGAPTARVLAREARGYQHRLSQDGISFGSDLGSPDAPNRCGTSKCWVVQTVKTPDGKEGRVLNRDTWGSNKVQQVWFGSRGRYQHRRRWFAAKFL